MKLIVTRDFNLDDIIGYLTLRDDVEILPDQDFALAYTVLEQSHTGRPTKIQVQSVSLVSKPYQTKEPAPRGSQHESE